MATGFGKILLLTGNSEFLSERTRRRAVRALLEERPECEVAESTASGLAPGELASLTSASLFSEASALVLTDLQDLPEVAATELLAHASDPSPDVAVVLVHGGGTKGKGLLDKLKAQASVTVVEQKAPKYERELTDWVRAEARELGRALEAEAAAALVSSVGADLRSLAGAVDQLVATTESGTSVTVEVVRRYFGGRAEVKGYEIADAAIEGRLSHALERARWAEENRVAAPVITAAFASGLRTLARVASAAPNLRDNELAAVVGAPPFKVRLLRQQMRSWDPDGLRRALAAVARADLDVKGGGAAEPGYAIERMIIQVAASRLRS